MTDERLTVVRPWADAELWEWYENDPKAHALGQLVNTALREQNALIAAESEGFRQDYERLALRGEPTMTTGEKEPNQLLLRAKLLLRTALPRVLWTVVERDGQPELVIWREWLGRAYDIASLAGEWGRWDRDRITHETAGGRVWRVSRGL